MNLFAVAELLASLAASPIHVNADRCLHAIDAHSTCDQCIRTCPSQALSPGKSITLNSEACVGCRQCLHDCPVGALTGVDKIADLWALAARPVDARRVEVACAAHPSPQIGPARTDAVLRFGGCLAALSPASYIGLLSLGFEQITVRLDACERCSIGKARSGIDQTIATTQELLAARQESDRITALSTDGGQKWTTRPVYAKKTDLSRRDLFRRLSLSHPPESESAVPNFDAHAREGQSPTAKEPPRERRRLLNALRQLPPLKPKTAPPPRLANLPFARMIADENCSACGTCARVCPTGAFNFAVSGEDQYQLTFTAGDCMNCGLCLKVCEPDALHREDPTLADVLAPEPVTLRAGTLRQCSKCGAKFASPTDRALCSVCEFRRQHPFGSQLPPGLLKQRKAMTRTEEAAHHQN